MNGFPWLTSCSKTNQISSAKTVSLAKEIICIKPVEIQQFCMGTFSSGQYLDSAEGVEEKVRGGHCSAVAPLHLKYPLCGAVQTPQNSSVKWNMIFSLHWFNKGTIDWFGFHFVRLGFNPFRIVVVPFLCLVHLKRIHWKRLCVTKTWEIN